VPPIKMFPNRGGHGDPNCPICKGSGHQLKEMGVGPPGVVSCACLHKQKILNHLERGCVGLSRVYDIDETPLVKYHNKNLWVTGSNRAFRQHLRKVALEVGLSWDFKVVPDGDLPRAWLANMSTYEILDLEMSAMEPTASTFEDLIEPPGLLIVQLGVRSLKMTPMPDAVRETLTRRDFLDKPTWITDQPQYRFQEGHICYSDRVMDILTGWDHFTLDAPSVLELETAPSGYIMIPARYANGPMEEAPPTSNGFKPVNVPLKESPKPKGTRKKTNNTTKKGGRHK